MQRNVQDLLLMKQIAKFFPLFLSMVMLLAACATDARVGNTTLVLVRHAEKANDGTDDPPLDSLGLLRAASLAHVLSDLNASAIYSTPYRRTRQTVEPLAAARQLEVKTYQPHDERFLPGLVSDNIGTTVVVSGHSNTIPAMANQLMGRKVFENLKEWEYDYLFIVNIGTDTTLQVLHYGQPTTTGK